MAIKYQSTMPTSDELWEGLEYIITLLSYSGDNITIHQLISGDSYLPVRDGFMVLVTPGELDQIKRLHEVTIMPHL